MSEPNDIEKAKLELDKERLELEKRKALSDQRFFSKNFATIVTALLSATAVIVSGSQVWLANIQKDKDGELQRLQGERQSNLEAAKFVFDHQKQLFGTDSNERNTLREIISAAFPPIVTKPLLSRLEEAQESVQSPANLRQFWKPDGSTVDKTHEDALKKWLAKNNIDGSIPYFLNSDQYRDARLKAVRELISSERNTDVPEASLSSIVESFKAQGATDVTTEKQPNGLWTVTAIHEKK